MRALYQRRIESGYFQRTFAVALAIPIRAKVKRFPALRGASRCPFSAQAGAWSLPKHKGLLLGSGAQAGSPGDHQKNGPYLSASRTKRLSRTGHSFEIVDSAVVFRDVNGVCFVLWPLSSHHVKSAHTQKRQDLASIEVVTGVRLITTRWLHRPRCTRSDAFSDTC